MFIGFCVYPSIRFFRHILSHKQVQYEQYHEKEKEKGGEWDLSIEVKVHPKMYCIFEMLRKPIAKEALWTVRYFDRYLQKREQDTISR